MTMFPVSPKVHLFPPSPNPPRSKKRLELAGGLWITADQIGGRILDAHPGVAADLVEQAARVVWASVAVGRQVEVTRYHQPPIVVGILENAWVIQ